MLQTSDQSTEIEDASLKFCKIITLIRETKTQLFFLLGSYTHAVGLDFTISSST